MAALNTPDFQELPPDVWEILEERVEEFEAAWALGQHPEISDYLLSPDPTCGQLLLELVHSDIEFRGLCGETRSLEDYLESLPDLKPRGELHEGLAQAIARAEGRSSKTRYLVESSVDEEAEHLNPDHDTRVYFPNDTEHGSSRTEQMLVGFERAWATGKAPRIEDYIVDTGELDPPRLFERLLAIEIRHRVSLGETPLYDDYAIRFPQFDEALQVFPWLRTDAQTVICVVAPGEKFAHFTLLNRVGSGAFGGVWKAHDDHLDRTVALKLLHPHRISEGALQLFLKEARAAAQLRHPNIVCIHEIQPDGDQPYLVLDYVDGSSLQQWLKKNTPSPSQTAEMVVTLCDALRHAHERGIVHRDIKPANVMIDGAGHPHIMDFGLAKRTAEDLTRTRERLVMGSVPYMSPEVAAGKARDADERTDIYGLGVLLYEMLTGRWPFEGTETAILRKLQLEDPLPPSQIRADVPRDLETICLKAMARDPAKRYASAADLAADLNRFLVGGAIVARRPSRLRRCLTQARQRPVLAALGPVALVLLGGWAGWAAMVRTDEGAGPGAPLLIPVSIVTDPPGAQMRFVPLNKYTAEPEPERMIDPGRSPVEEYELEPGDYLVVAALDDGRFHEVYRHVPDPAEGLAMVYNPFHWKRDDSGNIELDEIKIPDADVTEGMSLVPAAQRFYMGKPGSMIERMHLRSVPPFYMATTELSVRDYVKQWFVRYPPPSPEQKYKPKPPDIAPEDYDSPLAVYFHWYAAASVAEAHGARLPSESEYERAASMNKWLPPGPETPEGNFGPVGTLAEDVIPTDPPIYGLRSNVAEWTHDRYVVYPGTIPGNIRVVNLNSPDPTSRVVRGGGPEVWDATGEILPESRDPRGRFVTSMKTRKPGLGLRLVRSAKPRLTPEDFEVMHSWEQIPTSPPRPTRTNNANDAPMRE